MDVASERAPAAQLEELGRFFVERVNAGVVNGLVALYEPGAVLALPNGQIAAGAEAIRQFYQRLLANRPALTPDRNGPGCVMATWR